MSQYVNQLNSLIIIRHLNPLVIGAQKHRGASLALLEGDESYETQVDALQREISTRLEALGHLNEIYNFIIPEKKWNEVSQEWGALTAQWREDGVVTNFEFHCHFIERLMRLMWKVVLDTNYFFSSKLIKEGSINTLAISGDEPSFNNIDHHFIVQLIAKDVPRLIETIAKIRGLATHAAVMKSCDQNHQTRLIHLLQTFSYQKEKIRGIPRSLKKETLQSLPTLMETLLHEHKLSQLLQTINNEIITSSDVTIDSHVIFDLATEIIDVYSAVIDQGLVLIQKNIDASLIA